MLASKLHSRQYCIVCEQWSISSLREWTLPLVCCPMPFNQQRMGATGESTMISQAGGRSRRRIEDRFFCAPILLLSPLSAAHLYAEDRPTDCDRRSQGRAHGGSLPRSNNHVGNNDHGDAGARLGAEQKVFWKVSLIVSLLSAKFSSKLGWKD